MQIAGGTVTGRDHVTMGRNNQDAFCWSATDETIVAVVADGCGSGTHSEVGAQVGARILAEALRAWTSRFDDEPAEAVLEHARQTVLAQLRVLASAMGGRLSQAVSDYFLFTTLGFVVSGRQAVVFGIGDGLVAVNGEVRRLTAVDNAPPYLGYGLTASSFDEGALRFVVHDRRPRADVRSLLVATDGAFEIGGLADFWEQDRYFQNPFNVGRRLCQLNRRSAVLGDDTTVVVARVR